MTPTIDLSERLQSMMSPIGQYDTQRDMGDTHSQAIEAVAQCAYNAGYRHGRGELRIETDNLRLRLNTVYRNCQYLCGRLAEAEALLNEIEGYHPEWAGRIHELTERDDGCNEGDV